MMDKPTVNHVVDRYQLERKLDYLRLLTSVKETIFTGVTPIPKRIDDICNSIEKDLELSNEGLTVGGFIDEMYVSPLLNKDLGKEVKAVLDSSIPISSGGIVSRGVVSVGVSSGEIIPYNPDSKELVVPLGTKLAKAVEEAVTKAFGKKD